MILTKILTWSMKPLDGIKMNAVTPIGRSIDADVIYIVCAHCRGQRQ